jgi:hypothetical protein
MANDDMSRASLHLSVCVTPNHFVVDVLHLLLLLAVCTDSPLQPGHSSFDCPIPALPGSVCNATCDAGYAGAPSATCQADGTYSAVAGACGLIGAHQICDMCSAILHRCRLDLSLSSTLWTM